MVRFMKPTTLSTFLCLVIALFLAGCTEPTDTQDTTATVAQGSSLQIIAINDPLAYFTARLGGDSVSVLNPTVPGEDPALWSPEAEDVLRMQQADLIVLNGAGYEPWLDRISLSKNKVLDTSIRLADQTIFIDSVTHQHGPEGDHSHAASAFTWWLDPLLALEQARAIEAALVTQLPTATPAIQQRFASLAEDIQDLHQQWQVLSTSLHEEPILFSHPVYQYFEHRYQLDGHSLHWEPDQDPGSAQWSALEELLKSQPATIMVWEQAPLETTRERLDAMGVQVVVIDPGAAARSEPDYLSVQRANISALQELLTARSRQP